MRPAGVLALVADLVPPTMTASCRGSSSQSVGVPSGVCCLASSSRDAGKFDSLSG